MSEHLVVLVHGLWGNPDHMWYVKKALVDRHEKIETLVSSTNVGNRTYDGVDVCGERIAKEVREKVKELDTKGTPIKRISFVGYSLGGLGARYAIGVLNTAGFFNDVEPVTYTTFATPHCGVSPTSGGFFSWLVSSIGPKTLSVTGAHLFLADGLVKKRTLLETMSDPAGPFYKGLELFRTRTSYANIANDRSVPYFTAAITDSDPFSDMTKVVLNHDEKYGNVILKHDSPYKLAGEEKVEVKKYPLTYRELAFRSVMVAGLPLWLTLYSANAVVANYNSSRRIALHRQENGEDGEQSLSSMTQDAIEEVLDSKERKGEEEVLKLNAAQISIVDSLNKLPWQKFQVHIQRTQHSHAAIVCRTPDSERLMEGHEVMRHWLDKVFVV